MDKEIKRSCDHECSRKHQDSGFIRKANHQFSNVLPFILWYGSDKSWAAGWRGQSEKLGTYQKGDSLYFNYLNRGKKSIILDITTAEGTEILEKLIPFYDVICVGEEAGYMESLGLGYGKPDIIYASYSYYGETGSYKNKPVSSLTA